MITETTAVKPGVASIQVVLDTNVIISGMAYTASAPGKIMQAWRSGAIEVYPKQKRQQRKPRPSGRSQPH